MPADRVAQALRAPAPTWGDADRVLWLGDAILELDDGLLLHHAGGPTPLPVRGKARDWALTLLEQAHPSEPPLRWAEVRDRFPGEPAALSRLLRALRPAGLVAV